MTSPTARVRKAGNGAAPCIVAYTGITRGKRVVVLVGQRKAVAIAVKNVSGRRRWSKLDQWLGPPPADTRQLMNDSALRDAKA
jgi:exodeoxyribonuclease V alpha subunit